MIFKKNCIKKKDLKKKEKLVVHFFSGVGKSNQVR
jgi:hypothetical protein